VNVSGTSPFFTAIGIHPGYASSSLALATEIFLGVHHFYLSRTGSGVLSNQGVTLRASATRLSALYWQIDFVLSNANDNSIAADLAVYHYGALYKPGLFVSNGVGQGVTLTSTSSALTHFEYILLNNSAVTPVTGLWVGTDTRSFSHLWTKEWNVASYTSSYLYIAFNWQQVPVLAHSSTNLTILVGHLDPPDGIPAAVPTPVPETLPDASEFDYLNLTTGPLAFSMLGINRLGQTVSFVSTTYTFLAVGDMYTSASATSGSSLTCAGVTLTKTLNAVTPTWWEVNYHLTTSETAAVSVHIAFYLTFSAGLFSEVWSPYATRGLFVSRDCDESHTLTFILRNTSVVTPVTGWWIGTGGSYLSSGIVWSTLMNTTSITNDRAHASLAANWQNLPVYPNSSTTVKFLVGHGDIPLIGDLNEPTRSPRPTQTPFATAPSTVTYPATVPATHTATPAKSPDPTLTPTGHFTPAWSHRVKRRWLVKTHLFTFLLVSYDLPR
jgi:hypothetical protein